MGTEQYVVKMWNAGCPVDFIAQMADITIAEVVMILSCYNGLADAPEVQR